MGKGGVSDMVVGQLSVVSDVGCACGRSRLVAKGDAKGFIAFSQGKQVTGEPRNLSMVIEKAHSAFVKRIRGRKARKIRAARCQQVVVAKPGSASFKPRGIGPVIDQDFKPQSF